MNISRQQVNVMGMGTLYEQICRGEVNNNLLMKMMMMMKMMICFNSLRAVKEEN